MREKFRHPACTFLRKLISPYGYGSKDAFGYRRPTNKALLADYNRKGIIKGLTNARMLDHFRGGATHYFWADGRIKTPYALLKIDIDNHKVGSLAAALAFARYLRDMFCPGLYFEVSTNGNGVHAYVLIDKRGFGDERLHGLAKMLDRSLKAIHRRWQAENPALVVEGVEIKGHPPRITWGHDGNMDNLISGQFAKLPREMLERFEEFRRTTVLDDRQISHLCMRFQDEPVVPVKPVVETVKTSGSLTGCVVKQSNLDQWDSYLAVARKLVVQPLKTRGREVATAEDMAVVLLILEACTNAMNPDGSMPTARIKENWDILFDNGDVERRWSPRRYTALRDLLSSQGYIDWEDRRYLPAALSPDGKGRAAKWRAAESLMEMLEGEKLGPTPASTIVEGEGDVAGDELGVVFTGYRGREEDLYCDKIHFLPFIAPDPPWLANLKRQQPLRPLLDVGVVDLRMAA